MLWFLDYRFNIITEVEAKGMNTFVGNFSLPALIFISLCQLDFSTVNYKFLLAILVSVGSIPVSCSPRKSPTLKKQGYSGPDSSQQRQGIENLALNYVFWLGLFKEGSK